MSEIDADEMIVFRTLADRAAVTEPGYIIPKLAEAVHKLLAEVERQQQELDRLRRYLSHDIHWKMMATSAHLWGWGALYPHEKAPAGTPCYISPADCDRIVDAAVGKLRKLIAQRLEPEAEEPDGSAPIESAPAAEGSGTPEVDHE